MRLVPVLLCLLTSYHCCQAEGLDFDAGGLDVDGSDDDLEKELGLEDAEWWNSQWRFRRRVILEGAGLLNTQTRTVWLDGFDPMLLFNSGRCGDRLSDVRIVSQDGKVLKSGLVGFGFDDGRCRYWFETPAHSRGTNLTVYMYYGNPAVKATNSVPPMPASTPASDVSVRHLPEQARPGTSLLAPPAAGQFFKEKRFIEVEDMTDEMGKAVHVKQQSRLATASNGIYVDHTPDLPLILRTDIILPAAGTWRLHLRYRQQTQPAGVSLKVGSAEVRVQLTSAAVDGFVWASKSLELNDGKQVLTLGVEQGEHAALDCILLTQDHTYLPDHRDFNGPVWMRFRLRNNDVEPYHIDLFNWNVTYSTLGMQGETSCWLFEDRMVEIRSLAKELAAKKKSLIKPGSWTPWGRALPSGSWTWFCEVRFVGAETGLDVDYEFATRPESSRVFRAGSENTGLTNNLFVRMPSSVHWRHVESMTRTFGEWGRERFEMAKSLNFKAGEGPQQIVAGTMAEARSLEEAAAIFKTCSWLGLNTIDVSMLGQAGSEVFEPLFRESGIKWWWSHTWVHDQGTAVGVPVDPAKTATENATLDMAARGDSYYRSAAERSAKQSPERFQRTRINTMGDEIGAFASFESINASAALRAQFVEYLQAHELSPDFFGYPNWDELRAFGYAQPLTPEQQKKEATRTAEKATEAEFEKAAKAVGIGALPGQGEKSADTVDEEIQRATEEEARKAEAKLSRADPMKTDKFLKRAWHWTQKFRSHYTAFFLRHYSAGMRKHFPETMNGGANLQAMPVQIGRMWDGELNIFDLGRENAMDVLQVEDWWGGPNNVAYSMSLMRAAGRKHGQQLGALIVGGQPGTRIISNLMEGCRFFLFYLYGPIYRIGPVWAEDIHTYREIGETMRQIARCEDDILAATPRPAQAALLVANTSEINAAFFAYPIGRERISVFAALKDSQVPVEVVGEEEVIEDRALDRYRILYVTDPHVDSRAQAKIKDWVRRGGTLWADYAGLARQEYDERAKPMDEVLGLEERGPVEPFTVGGRGWGGYGNILTPEGQGLDIPAGKLFKTDNIQGLHTSAGIRGLFYKPDFKLSTGTTLARFDNRSPAIVHNKYGKGQAFLFGFQAGFAYTGCRGNWTHALPFSEPSTALRAQLMVAPATAASVKRNLVIDHHFMQTSVHDGPKQTVVYLNNLGEDATDKELKVAMITLPRSAYSSRGREVVFEFQNGIASTTVNLKRGQAEILVFRTAD